VVGGFGCTNNYKVFTYWLRCDKLLNKGGDIMLRKTEEITVLRMAEIERLVNEFRDKLEKGFLNAQDNISINEIEDLWTRLRTSSDSVYADLLSDYLMSVDERDVILQKKTNTEKKE
jgi:hypothetical protein